MSRLLFASPLLPPPTPLATNLAQCLGLGRLFFNSCLPPSLNATHLIAFPTQAPQATINSANAQRYPHLHMRDYFPLSLSKPKAYNPDNPQPSPTEILQRIRKSIEDSKLAALTC